MKLSEIFTLLALGEMAQLYTGLRDEDGIDEEHQRQVGGSVQLALTALYTRFDLKQSQLELRLVPGKRDYKLHSKYADNGKNTTEPTRWIADSSDAPFVDDILKIQRLVTPVGLLVGLNDQINPFSAFTPTMDSLRVPNAMVNDIPGTPEYLKVLSLSVEYKANHPAIMPRIGYFNPDLSEVELPQAYVQALLYFVASRASNPVGMGQEFNGGNQWYQKYELECRRLEANGMDIEADNTPSRLRQKGFV